MERHWKGGDGGFKAAFTFLKNLNARQFSDDWVLIKAGLRERTPTAKTHATMFDFQREFTGFSGLN
jgi:hypothetical protein